jgi:2-C-methyl-D-erythritol 2,4-cyclodiphosphate synthase
VSGGAACAKLAQQTTSAPALATAFLALSLTLLPATPNPHPSSRRRASPTAAAATQTSLPFRVGHGFDLHRLEEGDYKLILGGIEIPHDRGCVAHSDGDALLHTVTDAILGALARPDIGQLFPDTDPKWKGATSDVFVREAVRLMEGDGYELGNIDVTVILQRPKVCWCVVLFVCVACGVGGEFEHPRSWCSYSWPRLPGTAAVVAAGVASPVPFWRPRQRRHSRRHLFVSPHTPLHPLVTTFFFSCRRTRRPSGPTCASCWTPTPRSSISRPRRTKRWTPWARDGAWQYTRWCCCCGNDVGWV